MLYNCYRFLQDWALPARFHRYWWPDVGSWVAKNIKIWNFWYKFAAKRQNPRCTEKPENRYTTKSIPLYKGTLIFFSKITLLNSVSIFTNSIIWSLPNKKNKNITFFHLQLVCPKQTCHSDRGDLSYFCTPKIFPIQSVPLPQWAIQNLWENNHLMENAYIWLLVTECDQI